MTIEKVSNGYVLVLGGRTEIATSIEEVFERQLMFFEGKGKNFGGEMYGKVTVEYAKT